MKTLGKNIFNNSKTVMNMLPFKRRQQERYKVSGESRSQPKEMKINMWSLWKKHKRESTMTEINSTEL